MEIEDFIKGLRLLHSRSPESSDELKKLLDFYHAKKMNYNLESRKPKDSILNAFSSLQSLNQGIRGEDKKTKALEEDSETTDIEDNEMLDSNDASNIVNNQCIICKQGESNNRLLECQECRSCFHPECHKPIVPKKDINDPRSIWYCFKCKNTGRKLNKNAIVATNSGKVIIDPNKVVNAPKSTLDTMKRPNKIATTQSTPYHPILKAMSTTGTGMGNYVRQSSTVAIHANVTNKTKTSATIGSIHSAYNPSTTISNLDKRLANMKKTKSGLKFS
ncbi:integrator complex subunit 12 [Dermatophagoides farinae]|nr:integrator complex subunit 12-like [Dermatophagoides farinae]KAH9516471.1 Integrator complex subunit 12 [Dermatophagoides farinae]